MLVLDLGVFAIWVLAVVESGFHIGKLWPDIDGAAASLLDLLHQMQNDLFSLFNLLFQSLER